MCSVLDPFYTNRFLCHWTGSPKILLYTCSLFIYLFWWFRVSYLLSSILFLLVVVLQRGLLRVPF